MSTGWNIYRIHYEKLTGLDGQMKGAGQKSDSPFFLFVLLMESGSKYSICYALLTLTTLRVMRILEMTLSSSRLLVTESLTEISYVP